MSVKHRVTDDGTHEIGANVDGVFVPFVSLPGTTVDGLVQAGKQADAQTQGEQAPPEGSHA